jgi:hypothetical protein
MSASESVARVSEAIAEVEKVTVPVVHQMIGVAQKNVEQMTATSREVLQIVDSNVDRIAGAAVRLASSSAELAATVLGGIRVSTPPPTKEKPNR